MLALIIEIAIFAHLVWLGLYMLNRAGDDAVLRQAGRTGSGAGSRAGLCDGRMAGGVRPERCRPDFWPELASCSWPVA